MLICNEILEMYDDPEVKKLKDTLIKSGVKDSRRNFSLEKAIDLMTDKAYEIIQSNKLLDANGKISSETAIYYRCEICGKMETAEFDLENGNEQKSFDSIMEKYRALAQKFTKLGYPSEVKRICNDCARQKYPSMSRYHTNNLVFSLTRKDCGKTINSFPSLTWFEETPYKIALAFLNGADTLQKLSEATDTKLSADGYLEHIHNVLGDVSSKIR